MILKFNFVSNGRVQKKKGLILSGRQDSESAIENMIYHMGPKDVQAFDK